MTDKTLKCQTCQSEFVFSSDEQQLYASKNLPTPQLCLICRSIKLQQAKIPPKPAFSNPLSPQKSHKK